jgi:hypothetical protein
MAEKEQSGAQSLKEKNAIFYDRIQAETIRKELRVHKLYENYMLSPSVKTS